MGWTFKGVQRRWTSGADGDPVKTTWTPHMYATNGTYPYGFGPYGTNGGSYYEYYHGLMTVHGKLSFGGGVPGAYGGELIVDLPHAYISGVPEPVWYDTYQIVGLWAMERYGGGGGYGLVELTRQYDGIPVLKFLINRYHDASIAIMSASLVSYYFWTDSAFYFTVQYPVET